MKLTFRRSISDEYFFCFSSVLEGRNCFSDDKVLLLLLPIAALTAAVEVNFRAIEKLCILAERDLICESSSRSRERVARRLANFGSSTR